jgi:hypothetical protein
MRRSLVVLAFFSAAAALEAPAGSVGTAFTYQGQLRTNGPFVTGQCDFIFSLWDAASNGAQKGLDVPQTLTLAGGLFTTSLDFGKQFPGDARFLDIQTRCPAGSTWRPVSL